MFPVNDTEPNRYDSAAAITLSVIVINIAIHIGMEYVAYTQPWGAYRTIILTFGSVPANITGQQGWGVLSSLTSTFLHGGWLHLGGNMLALWVFGRRVEDACGPGRFLLFYLLCGLTADALDSLIRASSPVPGIGASGAIYGVMGAYLILFPGGRIRTFIMLWFVPLFPRIRAFWIVLYFVIFQYVSAFIVLISGADPNYNYWAHLGGFFGGLFIFFFLRPEAFARYLNDTPV